MTSNHLQDYICDVFMDLGSEFYPLPLVNVPNLPIVKPTMPSYSFDVERRAIEEYERDRDRARLAANEAGKQRVVKESEPVEKNLRKTHSDGILEPSRASSANPSARLRKPTGPVAGTMNSFEEFEAKPNLFDLLEMHTIDDKAALEQVLLGNSQCQAASSSHDALPSEPPKVGMPPPDSVAMPLPDSKVNGSMATQPSMDAACSLSSLSNERHLGQAVSFPSQWPTPGSAERVPKRNGNVSRGHDGYERLRSKGYPESCISLCAKTLPEHLKPQMECYVKSVAGLTKLGAEPKSALSSLLRFNFHEERRVLGFVETTGQLCALGFGVDAVIEALRVCGARRDDALERLLEK